MLSEALGDAELAEAAEEDIALGETLALVVDSGAVLAAGVDEALVAVLAAGLDTVGVALGRGELVAGAGALLDTGATLLGTAGAL